MQQGGEGLRVTGPAVQGGSVTVNVGPNDETVEISPSGSEDSESFEVPGDKDTPIPVPPVPPGTTIVIRIGKGKRKRRIFVEVIAPTP
jgi:hypothetical protein